MPIQVTDATFDAEVLENEQPVLVDFWAAWCGPCKALSPIIDEIARDFDGRLKVVKVEVDQAPRAADRFGVFSIPTIVVVSGGLIESRFVGYRTKEALVAAVKPYLAA